VFAVAPFAAASPTLAQEPLVVIRAARLLDVERGEIVTDVVVVVEGERIAAVNPDALPDGAETIDLGDVTLLPGLIDAHTHLTGDLEGDWVHRGVTGTTAEAALNGARNARRTLEAGFTTVRDLGASGFADVALARAIEAGWIEGPRVIPAGHALGITGGHCDETGYAPGILERDWRGR
jgi:imidazolonepropionase-like amidohydrolase